MSEQSPGVTIKVVAERTGVSVHTLRAWERRYGIPKPGRDTGNRYRLYDEEQVADVLWLKRQIESGVSPALASALRRQQQSHPIVSGTAAPPLAEFRKTLETALAISDQTTARQTLEQVFALTSPEQVMLEIIEPTMQELGARWQRNEIDVWQEHLASNLIRQRLLSLMQAQPEVSATAFSLVAACAPAEEHELGLLFLALLALRQGWQVAYLGQRTPLQNFLSLAQKKQWVAISVTTAFGLASLVPLLGEAELPRTRLLFGGYLTNRVPRLREHLPGIFLDTNARDAIRALGTREVKPNAWMPAKKELRAGLQLHDERLNLCAQMIAELASARGSKSTRGLWFDVQALMTPTLFLIDTLASALTFEVPELLDAEDFWLTQFMPRHGISTPLIERYLTTFSRVFNETHEKDTALRVGVLLERMQLASPLIPAGDEKRASIERFIQ